MKMRVIKVDDNSFVIQRKQDKEWVDVRIKDNQQDAINIAQQILKREQVKKDDADQVVWSSE